MCPVSESTGLVRWVSPEGAPPLGWLASCELVVVTSLADVRCMVDELSAAPYVAFDTETTGLAVIDDRLVALQFAGSATKSFFIAIDMLDPRFTNLPLTQVIALCEPIWTKGVVAHNAGFDWKMMVQQGADFAIVADTMLESKLYDVYRHSALKDCAKDLLGLDEVIKFKDLFPKKLKTALRRFDSVEYDKAVPYGSQDPLATWRLHGWFLDHGVDPTNFIYQLEHAVIKPISEMELLGIALDVEKIEAAKIETEKLLLAQQALIDQMAGRHVELSKPADVRALLFDELKLPVIRVSEKTQVPSTDAKVMKALEPKHPIIKEIGVYREYDKMRVGFLDPLPTFVQRDGCVHTSYHQYGAVTGRPSASDPNLQQIPKEKGDKANDKLRAAVRSSFVPPPGYAGLLDIDYSQLEYRLYASLSGDQHLLHAFYQGADVHAQTASLMFGTPLDQVSKADRGRGKTINFATIYGQGPAALAATLGVSVREAQQLQRDYFVKLPQAAAYVQYLKDFAHQHGYCQTFFGRRRPLLYINSGNKGFAAADERCAVNSPIQGTGADLLKLAIVRASTTLKDGGFKSRLCLMVHDELVIAHHADDDLDALSEVIRAAMEMDEEVKSYGWCPLISEPGYGKNWADIDDFVYPSRRKDGTTGLMVNTGSAPRATGKALALPEVGHVTNERVTIIMPAGYTDALVEALQREFAARPGPVALFLEIDGEDVPAGPPISVDRKFLLQLKAEGVSYRLSDALSRRLMRAA